MPFTFSHPAIVLPLAYLSPRWVSLTGLVVGSITPDFEYFLRMRINSQYSHYNWGVFWFDLPLGLLLCFVFHQWVRQALFANLPHFLQVRFSPYYSFNWWTHFRKNWGVVIISLLVGIISHLFWDRFTHKHAYFVDMFPVLNQHVAYHPYSFTWYRVIQHGSTILGALIVGFTIYKLPRYQPISNKVSLRFWAVTLLVAFVVFVLRVFLGVKSFLIGNLVVSIISAGMAGLIVAGLVWNRLKVRHT
ncbi:hypothetical protein BKI52_36715 [marine bacterium AO1-C]|nr:hypothetical protein BKI52_36715 [marine bacterium AO1-C]